MISYFSVNKPYTVIVAVIIVAILGVVSFTNMSTDLLPSINLPYTVVITTYIGASPEEVEMVVTRPIEQTMASIGNIKNIRSVSRENISLVILEFGENTNMDATVVEMRESLDMVTSYMSDKIGAPVIMKLNPDMMPIMVLSAAVKGQTISEASSFLETMIIPEFESIEGIASVSASGLIDNEIHVILRDEKINEINAKIQQAVMATMSSSVTALPTQAEPTSPDRAQTMQMPGISITKDMVSGILKGQNFNMPAGYVTEEGVDYLIRTGDKINGTDELKELSIITIPIPGFEPVRLKDIADIILIESTGNRYSKVNGNDAVTLTIQKQTEYTTSGIAETVRERITDITEKNENVEIVVLMDQGEYVDIVVNSLSMNIILGGLLAVLILLIFLRDFKPTLIVGFAIPVSLVAAFVMMYFSNITLNIISMGGLALGVGMLVDNSIVVIENIYRMRNEGKGVKEATVEGAKQVTGAILASTLTTVAVFVPILFTQGFTRQIFADMGLTIAFSLIASLMVALTVVPMMASKMLVKNTVKEHKFFSALKSRYTNALIFSLKHKWIVILVVTVLFATSVFGVLTMGTELFPSSDFGQISVNLNMPKGTIFEDTEKAADKVMTLIMGIDDVDTVGASMGGGMMSMFGSGRAMSGSTESVSFYVNLKDNKKNTTDEVAQLIREMVQSSDYEISVNSSDMDLTALSGGTIAVSVKGKDFEVLKSIATDLANIVSDVAGTIDVSDGIEATEPELMITVNKDNSIAKGLTVAQVYMQINKLLANEAASTTIAVGNKDYNIFVTDETGKANLTRKDIMEFLVLAPSGEEVPLGDIAVIEETKGFSSIHRNNRQRTITVRAELMDGYNIGKVSEEINDRLLEYQVPEGYTVEQEGENKMIRDSFRDLFLMLLMAVAFIYLIMTAQFQSLLSPFIVMFTIPLAFTGGFVALLITGKPVSIVAFVGLIVLAGIVVNNGIVFVDYVNKMREDGMSKKDAIIKAGNDRIRPILMTALTTIFALSTMSVGAGQGTEMMQPMAITAIGGLIYATLLTLIFIPVLYDSFNKEKKILK